MCPNMTTRIILSEVQAGLGFVSHMANKVNVLKFHTLSDKIA